MGTLLQIDGLSKPKPKSMVAMLVASILFGAGVGYLVKKTAQFGQAPVQQPSDVLVQNSYVNNNSDMPNGLRNKYSTNYNLA